MSQTAYCPTCGKPTTQQPSGRRTRCSICGTVTREDFMPEPKRRPIVDPIK